MGLFGKKNKEKINELSSLSNELKYKTAQLTAENNKLNSFR